MELEKLEELIKLTKELEKIKKEVEDLGENVNAMELLEYTYNPMALNSYGTFFDVLDNINNGIYHCKKAIVECVEDLKEDLEEENENE